MISVYNSIIIEINIQMIERYSGQNLVGITNNLFTMVVIIKHIVISFLKNRNKFIANKLKKNGT